MFKNKIAKIVLITVLGISLLLNVLLLIATKRMSDTQDAVSACSQSAQEFVKGKNYISESARKVASDRVYDECLKTRYGIDQRFK